MSMYLVTGGAGFIGSNLVTALVARGQDVRVLDNFSTGRRENLADVESKIELLDGSVEDAATCKRAVRGIDFVLHQAALPSVPRSVADPAASHAVNATGTLNLLVAARDAGVKRFVYASSSSVYGNTPELPKHEAMPVNPLSPYAVSKLCGEQYCAVFNRVYSLPAIMLRYFNVFGPKQDPNSPYAAVIPRFINALMEGKPPTVFGDGTQSRDFTYVDNAVSANLLACEAGPEAFGQAFNCASGVRRSLIEVLAALGSLLNVSIPAAFQAERSGDVTHSLADISKAQRVLHYAPAIDFDEGLKRTVAWYAASRSR